MSETKLSSDEVPGKFADWLLAMGCPPEKVPPVEKISQMCRGTYYLVWRSLMEQVESKDTIREKRLQVFADDVRRCKKKNLFTEAAERMKKYRERLKLNPQKYVEHKRKHAKLVKEKTKKVTELIDEEKQKPEPVFSPCGCRVRIVPLHVFPWMS